MEPQDILDLLPIIQSEPWTERLDGHIRILDEKYQNDDICPICALANEILGEKKYHIVAWTAGESINIPAQIITEIAEAADCPSHYLRSQLEQALGLR